MPQAPKGHVLCFKALVGQGNGDMRQRNSSGNTPVHIAFERGHKRMVKWMLTQPECQGGDSVLCARNLVGLTPPQMSAQAKVPPCLPLLPSSDASPKKCPRVLVDVITLFRWVFT